MAAMQISKNNFHDEVLKSEKKVLLDFWAPWCGPCRMVSPVIDEIAAERADIKVGKINVDQEPELAQRFGVMSIPTLVVMQGGKDFQVKADRDFRQYQELLADRDNVTFRLYPGLNHCFVPTLGMNIANAKKEYSKERHIPSEVFDDIAGWIKNN